MRERELNNVSVRSGRKEAWLNPIQTVDTFSTICSEPTGRCSEKTLTLPIILTIKRVRAETSRVDLPSYIQLTMGMLGFTLLVKLLINWALASVVLVYVFF